MRNWQPDFIYLISFGTSMSINVDLRIFRIVPTTSITVLLYDVVKERHEAVIKTVIKIFLGHRMVFRKPKSCNDLGVSSERVILAIDLEKYFLLPSNTLGKALYFKGVFKKLTHDTKSGRNDNT